MNKEVQDKIYELGLLMVQYRGRDGLGSTLNAITRLLEYGQLLDKKEALEEMMAESLGKLMESVGRKNGSQ